jgi:hypothetical protein
MNCVEKHQTMISQQCNIGFKVMQCYHIDWFESCRERYAIFM